MLQQYWGYDAFRPMQQEIIAEVLAGNDVLALLPTGGGKSICYQVPAMQMQGLCLVVSPLIALMLDQVQNLEQRGIKAMAIHSGMKPKEVDVALDNAIFGGYKFLYVSPERLLTDFFINRATRIPVNLIAVDEAHCISEWGYDFRPPYLQIAEIRKYYPAVPILALTASATTEVQEDIKNKLIFGREAKEFRQSFDRSNLIYGVVNHEDKKTKLLDVLTKVKGSGIIYTRTRRATVEVSNYLTKNGLKSAAYHAGMPPDERKQKQEKWKSGEVPLIVSTNAFGMGIDKPDVRIVAHYDIPDNLEAYYQEAGRGGRDGKKAYAVAFVSSKDLESIEKNLEGSFPTLNDVRNTYHALGNYLQIPLEGGLGESYDFEMGDFVKAFQLHPLKAFNALKILENYGYISMSHGVEDTSQLMFTTDHETLYRFEIAHPQFEPVIKTILRSYSGSMDVYVKINEDTLAKRLFQPVKEVILQLKELHKMQYLSYKPRKSKPQIMLIMERQPKENILSSDASLHTQIKIKKQKLSSILQYAIAKTKCRNRLILEYFGEDAPLHCGHCDYCIRRKAEEEKRNIIHEKIIASLKEKQNVLMDDFVKNISTDNITVLEVIRHLQDNGMVKIESNKISLA
ncbi:MAG: RecQ family ATP-dependent DNA helicase [Bacteroidetes bacterium]|nr:RecQ family ATP-dependent DNA helicase [Bacteroidota bacterium]